MLNLTIILFAAILVTGCAGVGQSATQGRTVGSAVGAATGAAIGHQYGVSGIGSRVGSDLGGVAGSVAGSALDARANKPQVTTQGTPPAQGAPLTKFCPEGGEQFPESFRYCPFHSSELKPLGSNH